MLSYNEVKIYYDNGQVEVTKILTSVFNSLLNNVSFKKVFPSDYRLFQIADLLCTFELLRIKLENKSLSRHELFFFGKESNLRRNYIRKLIAKEYKWSSFQDAIDRLTKKELIEFKGNNTVDRKYYIKLWPASNQRPFLLGIVSSATKKNCCRGKSVENAYKNTCIYIHWCTLKYMC